MDKGLLPDPNKLTIKELKSLLSEVGIQIPQTGQERKSFFVELFNDNKKKILEFKKKQMGITDDDESNDDDYFEYTDSQGVLRRIDRNPKINGDEPPKKRRKRSDSNPFQSAKGTTKIEAVFGGVGGLVHKNPEPKNVLVPQGTPSSLQDKYPLTTTSSSSLSSLSSLPSLPPSIPSISRNVTMQNTALSTTTTPSQKVNSQKASPQNVTPFTISRNTIPTVIPPQKVNSPRNVTSFTIPQSAIPVSFPAHDVNPQKTSPQNVSPPPPSQTTTTILQSSNSQPMSPPKVTRQNSSFVTPVENQVKIVDLSDLFNFGVQKPSNPSLAPLDGQSSIRQQSNPSSAQKQRLSGYQNWDDDAPVSFVPEQSSESEHNDEMLTSSHVEDCDKTDTSSPTKQNENVSKHKFSLKHYLKDESWKKFGIAFVVFVVSLLISFFALFYSGGDDIFCDNPNDINCIPCPENGVCRNGVVHCARGYWVYGKIFCVNKTTIQSHRFASYVSGKLSDENFFRKACENKFGQFKMGENELLSGFGKKMSKNEIDYAVKELFPKYKIRIDMDGNFYVDHSVSSYFSLRYMNCKLDSILTGLLILLVVVAIIQIRMIENTNRKKGYELYKKALACIEEKGFVPKGELHELVDEPTFGRWSKRQKKQWEIACILLERNPTIISGPRADGVEGFTKDKSDD